MHAVERGKLQEAQAKNTLRAVRMTPDAMDDYGKGTAGAHRLPLL